MQRRLFIQSSLAGAAAWFGSTHAAIPADRATGAVATWTFYDPRFAKSHTAARAFAHGSPLLPIESDATDLAALFLSLATARQPFRVTGVTTESVPFCLHHMLRSAGVAAPHMRRLDNDLFLWTLTTSTHTRG